MRNRPFGIERKWLLEALLCCQVCLQASFPPHQTLGPPLCSHTAFHVPLCSLDLDASLREEVPWSSNWWGGCCFFNPPDIWRFLGDIFTGWAWISDLLNLMPYDITSMWNVKKGTRESLYWTETDPQTWRTALRVAKGEGVGWTGSLGLADANYDI